MTALGAEAWYVYAVVPAAATVPGGIEAILPGATVTTIAEHSGTSCTALAAMVSLVPRGLFAPDAAENRAADPDWVAARAAAHHAVVTGIAACTACVPLGFGTLFAAADGVRAWLAAHAARLTDALEHLAGQQEWSVALIEAQSRHTSWLDQNDRTVQKLVAAAATAGPGAAFLLQRRVVAARDTARAAHAAQVARNVHAHLTALPCRTLREQANANAPATWSLLAPADNDLQSALNELSTAIGDTGLSLRVTGPWPPYAFARAALQEVPNG